MGTISAIIPTRGYIVASCIESVLDNLKDMDYRIVFSKGHSIPDCFTIPIRDELRFGANYIWLVEEDVEVPRYGLQSLLAADYDISAIDYPFPNGVGCAAYHKGKPLWCGTGCTLIKRRVFDGVWQPWFRTDVDYIINDDGTFTENEGVLNKYGGHDIYFCLKARRLGFTLGVVPNITARHFKIKKMGEAGVNNGAHEFTVYDHIKKINVMKGDPLDSDIFS